MAKFYEHEREGCVECGEPFWGTARAQFCSAACRVNFRLPLLRCRGTNARREARATKRRVPAPRAVCGAATASQAHTPLHTGQ